MTKITHRNEVDPRTHKVSVQVEVSANDYDALKNTLSSEAFDKIQIHREMETMREVFAMEGGTIADKAENAIRVWSCADEDKPTPCVKIPEMYKLKYRY